LPGYSFVQYVIEIDTPVDPLLEIRSPGLGMFPKNIDAAREALEAARKTGRTFEKMHEALTDCLAMISGEVSGPQQVNHIMSRARAALAAAEAVEETP
jgi:hypothetical protein